MFDSARQAQGFQSQAHLDAFFAHYDHTTACADCASRNGYVALDDGMQPTMGQCDVARRLDAAVSRAAVPALSLRTMVANLAQSISDAVRLTAHHVAFGSAPLALVLGQRVFVRDAAQLGIVMRVLGGGRYEVVTPPSRYRPDEGNWTFTYRERDLRSAEFTI